jgi:hypothetical protein
MNERILELAKQAGLKFPSETALSPVEIKFAELIIWEAIGLCKVDVDALIGPFLSEYEKGIVEGYRRANENLRGYFGFEE